MALKTVGALGRVECWYGDKAGTALLRWLPLGRGGFGIGVTGKMPVPLRFLGPVGPEGVGVWGDGGGVIAREACAGGTDFSNTAWK